MCRTGGIFVPPKQTGAAVNAGEEFFFSPDKFFRTQLTPQRNGSQDIAFAFRDWEVIGILFTWGNSDALMAA